MNGPDLPFVDHRTVLLIGIMAYIAIQLLVGVLASRRIATNEDYLLAGRSLGYGLGTFTIFATWFGAESCIGSAGRAYNYGLRAGEVDPFGYSICLVLLGAVFATRFWKARFVTLGDLFRDRFSMTIERMSILLLVPTSIFWAAAQLRAFGQVLSATTGMSIELAITIAIVVTLIYTVSGGMLADAVTDLVQGIALILGLGVIFAAVVFSQGWDLFERIPADRLRLFGEPTRPWHVTLNAWAIPVLNAVVSQELVARTLASKSAVVARNNCFLAGGMYLVIGLMPFALGIVGPLLVPNLEDPEQILPVLAQTYLSPWMYVLFAGAIVSALLSTIDSALLASAALMTNNLLRPVLRHRSDRWKVNLSRLFVVLLGLSAYIVAFTSDSVFELVQESSSLGASSLFVVIVFGLFTRFGGSWSAGGAMIAGLGVYLWTRWAPGAGEPSDGAGFLWSLISAGVTYIAIALFEPRHFPLSGHGVKPDAEVAT